MSTAVAANSWRFEPATSCLGYPGLIFPNFAGSAEDRITASGDRSFDIGNYTFIERTTKVFLRHQWHYIAIRLERNQKMLAPATASAPFVAFSPPGFEADPNTVVTSEMLELLVDGAGAYEIEVLGEWMFVFREGDYPCFAPEWWQRMLRVTELAQKRDAAPAS